LHGREHDLKIERRATYDIQRFGSGRHLRQRFVTLTRPLSEFLQIGREARRGSLFSYFTLVFLYPPLGRSGIEPPHSPPPAKDHAKIN
jgi:hypothetical protein